MLDISVAKTAPFATIHNERFWGVPLPDEHIPQLAPGARILDAGCGTADGKLLSIVLEANQSVAPEVVRLDYFSENVEANPAQSSRLVADATEMPFADGTFDLVITSEITPDNPYFTGLLELQRYNRRLLGAEISRVLCAGGTWLGYNESLVMPDDRPAGMVGRFQYASSIPIAHNRVAYGLSFGVFQKVRDPIDPVRVGRRASLRLGHYNDDFMRELNARYRVSDVLGKDAMRAARKGDDTELQATAGYYYSEQNPIERRILLDAIKHGYWGPWTLQRPYADVESHLNALAHYTGWRVVEASGDRKTEKMLRSATMEPATYLIGHKGRAVALPTQWMMDTLIERRTTQRTELDKKTIAYVPVAEI